MTDLCPTCGPRLVNGRCSCPGQIVAISASDAAESAFLLSGPSHFAEQWRTRFRQIGPLVFERSAEGWELHLGNEISLTLPDGPLFSGDYPADVQKDVLLKSLADAGYTMGREHVRLSSEIRSLRAKLMRERANAHEIRSKLEKAEASDLARDGMMDMAAMSSRLCAQFIVRARRLRAEAERVEGGGR